MADVLDRIVARRREDLARQKQAVPPAVLERRLAARPARRPFAAALAGKDVAVIAEIKRNAPSAGTLQAAADPAAWAQLYAAGGAAALSVLTEPRYFAGSLADLQAARAACRLAVLRKDFLFDPYQLLESAAAGADAVLLIARILSPKQLTDLLGEAAALGLEALVEVHDRGELERALGCGAQLIGINNRDLGDFSVDLNKAVGLLAELPPGVVAVAESGIERPDQVALLKEAGAAAVLVGSSLMRAAEPQRLLAELVAAGRR